MPLLTLLVVLVLVACAANEATYRVGHAGTLQARTEAEQTHSQLISEASSFGNLDSPLKVLASPLPDYPQSLRDANITGTVRIRFLIEEDGKVSNPTVLGSLPAALAAISLNAVMRWRFEPPIRNGAPTKARAEQEFNFTVK